MDDPTKEKELVVDIQPGRFQDGRLGVMLMLSAGAITTDLTGEPVPGICLESWQARWTAYKLLHLAEDVEARMRLGLR